MRVILIGGGIGGLCAALALRHRGIESVVFERAPQTRESPVGLGLGASALAGLDRMGVLDGVLARACVVRSREIRDERGGLLGDLTEPATPGRFPEIMIHKAELVEVLLDGLPRHAVQFARALSNFRQDSEGVVARLGGGQTRAGDVLVGCDGLFSTVRSELLGHEPPRYGGYTSYQGVCAWAGRAMEGHVCEVWGRGLRFGFTPLPGGRMAWWAMANRAAGARDDNPGTALAQMFARWFEPVPSIVRATPARAMVRQDIFDRPPAASWTRGRVTLLGDAAHPTTPGTADMGHGAGLAIEDSVALARWLDRAAHREISVPEALMGYEGERLAHTSKIVRRSRMLGSMGQWESKPLTMLRESALKVLPSAFFLPGGKGVANEDA